MRQISEKFAGCVKETVAIIGSGHSGCALAADLKSRGYQVCLYAHPQHATRLQSIVERGGLAYRGVISGWCAPDIMTTDIDEALSSSENVILALPSYAQEMMFGLMAPHINEGHRIINLNGNFSSFILDRCLDGRKPVIVETNSAPHASRADEFGNVEILGVKKFIPIAALHDGISEVDIAKISNILPCQLEWQKDVIAVSMQAYNGVLHPATMVLNAARVEEEKFLFYAQGISPSVSRVVEQIDRERLQIAAQYGHKNLRTTLEALCGIYNESGMASVAQFAKEAMVYREIFAPQDMRSRYVTEDVPYVLVPWYLLGQRVGVEARAMRGIIDQASLMHEVDYLHSGRTLDKMNLPKIGVGSAQQYQLQSCEM